MEPVVGQSLMGYREANPHCCGRHTQGYVRPTKALQQHATQWARDTPGHHPSPRGPSSRLPHVLRATPRPGTTRRRAPPGPFLLAMLPPHNSTHHPPPHQKTPNPALARCARSEPKRPRVIPARFFVRSRSRSPQLTPEAYFYSKRPCVSQRLTVAGGCGLASESTHGREDENATAPSTRPCVCDLFTHRDAGDPTPMRPVNLQSMNLTHRRRLAITLPVPAAWSTRSSPPPAPTPWPPG